MTPSPRNVSPKISTLVSDVDGTLVTDDKVLTARTQAAVAKLHACGIKFCNHQQPTTSRLGHAAPAFGNHDAGVWL